MRLSFARVRNILMAVALVIAGMVFLTGPANGTGNHDDDPCTPSEGTPDSYTEWTKTGYTPVQHGGDPVPPGPDTDLKKYVGPITWQHKIADATEGTEGHWQGLQWYNWTPGGDQWDSDGDPPLDDPRWHATQGDPQSDVHSVAIRGVNDPYFVSHGNSGNGDWFLWKGTWVEGTPGSDAVYETDSKYKIYERTLIPGDDPVDCPPEECPEDGPAGANLTPSEESTECDGKKIVVCKFVGTPPGTLDHVVIVSVNTLNNVVDADGHPFAGLFPFSWTDAHGQTQEGSVAIRYAAEGEQAKDVLLSECSEDEEPPDECELPGIQPEDFPCSQRPVTGQDPWTGQPNCDTRTVSSGYTPWTRSWSFVADPPGPGSWVLGQKVFGQTVVTDTRDATLQECPPPAPMPVQQTTGGCQPGFGLPPGSWERDGLQEYVLDGTTWVLEDEALIAWDEWTGEAWDDEEIFANCAEVKPAEQVRTMSGGRESCQLGGVVAWTDSWTTDWVFNTGSQEWELGTEVGPVRDREFTPYTKRELKALGCVEAPEVAGEQAEVIDHQLPAVAPEVAGEQAVPGAVNAGLAGTLGAVPAAHNPLWLLAVGGGAALMGAAGWRRRTTADR